jgi:type II secretory pathway pseudopilin PulG
MKNLSSKGNPPDPKLNRRISARGFTLIELLLAMAFMVAVAVLAIPAISGMVTKLQRQSGSG